MIDLVGFKIKLFRDLEADASDVEHCLLFANHFPVRVLPFFAPVLHPPLLTADSLWHVFVNAAPGFRAGPNPPWASKQHLSLSLLPAALWNVLPATPFTRTVQVRRKPGASRGHLQNVAPDIPNSGASTPRGALSMAPLACPYFSIDLLADISVLVILRVAGSGGSSRPSSSLVFYVLFSFFDFILHTLRDSERLGPPRVVCPIELTSTWRCHSDPCSVEQGLHENFVKGHLLVPTRSVASSFICHTTFTFPIEHSPSGENQNAIPVAV